eukprot:1147320-Rhodomonas_salina.3
MMITARIISDGDDPRLRAVAASCDQGAQVRRSEWRDRKRAEPHQERPLRQQDHGRLTLLFIPPTQ